MNRLFLMFFIIVFSVRSHAAILVFSPDGTYSTKVDLSTAVTSSDTAGKTIVVTSALSAVQSNISSATVHAWPSDRALKIEKGGSINPTTKFTGLKESRPEWFGAKGDGLLSSAAANTTAFRKALAASNTVLLSEGTYYVSIALTAGQTYKTIKAINRDKTILKAATKSAKVISLQSAHYFTLENVTITNDVGNDGTSNGIYSEGSSFLVLKNVWISEFNYNLYLTGVNEIRLYSVRSFNAIYNKGVSGVNLYMNGVAGGGTEVFVFDSTFGGGIVAGKNRYGIYYDQLDAPVFSNVECLSNDYNFFGTRTASGYNIGPFLSNVFFDRAKEKSLYLANMLNASSSNLWVNSSQTGGEGTAVHLNNVKFSILDMNIYQNIGAKALLLSAGSHYNKIKGSIHDNAGTGVTIEHGASGNDVSASIYGNAGIGVVFSDTSSTPNVFSGTPPSTNSGGNFSVQAKDWVTTEGIWTPVLDYVTDKVGNFTYSVQSGSFIRTGRMVVCRFTIKWTGKPISGSTLLITGLPYNVTTGNDTGGFFSYLKGISFTNLDGATGTMLTIGPYKLNSAGIYVSGSGMTSSDLAIGNSSMGTSGTMMGEIIYQL